MGAGKASHPECHFLASGAAAVINFPLWKASAIGQSGFDKQRPGTFLQRYVEAIKPPYKGVAATILGMTWARAFIFYGSDVGKRELEERGYTSRVVSVGLPPLVLSTTVQLINMPIIRASITIQDFMERTLDEADPADRWATLSRSAKKSVAAGVAGAALTNPVDVLRNEMFKTDLSVGKALAKLRQDEGLGFALRGMHKNLVAVAIPIAVTIFLTDFLVRAVESEKR